MCARSRKSKSAPNRKPDGVCGWASEMSSIWPISCLAAFTIYSLIKSNMIENVDMLTTEKLSKTFRHNSNFRCAKRRGKGVKLKVYLYDARFGLSSLRTFLVAVKTIFISFSISFRAAEKTSEFNGRETRKVYFDRSMGENRFYGQHYAMFFMLSFGIVKS